MNESQEDIFHKHYEKLNDAQREAVDQIEAKAHEKIRQNKRAPRLENY
jgi:DNA-directed RNA polymerase sigma subunit (sigma70/sigma32)